MPRSIAKDCLRFTGLFEAELLTELILRQWRHPHAASAEYRSNLLESAAEVLRASIRGERLFDDLGNADFRRRHLLRGFRGLATGAEQERGKGQGQAPESVVGPFHV